MVPIKYLGSWSEMLLNSKERQGYPCSQICEGIDLRLDQSAQCLMFGRCGEVRPATAKCVEVKNFLAAGSIV